MLTEHTPAYLDTLHGLQCCRIAKYFVILNISIFLFDMFDLFEEL